MTTITLLPQPPLRNDPQNFPERGDNFLGALPTFAVELNAVASEINTFRDEAVNASINATNASNTAVAGANFKGNWSALSGAITRPASVAHSNRFWMLLPASLANVATSQPGVSADWVEIKNVLGRYSYANRNQVRSLTPNTNDQLIIESLGLFCWYNITTEIDDDETCFATATGRWLLECAGPEFVYTVVQSSNNILREDLEDIRTRIDTAFLIGTGVSGITSVASVTQTSFNILVPGAETDDPVFVNPPNNLTHNVSVHARVTSADTVTVYLNNASAGSATITDGVWKAVVIKEK